MNNPQTKICTKCKINKEFTEFKKEKNGKYGLRSQCISCVNTKTANFRKTKQGVITVLYAHQIDKSKKRGHKPPTHTNKELSDWLLHDWLFDLLFNNWVNSGYLTNMKPSIDRLDDTKGYSLDNIQLMTWAENKEKGYRDMRRGKITHGVNPQKAVLQFTSKGVFIKEFVSASEACRQTKIHYVSISLVCREKRNHAGGFRWKFK